MKSTYQQVYEAAILFEKDPLKAEIALKKATKNGCIDESKIGSSIHGAVTELAREHMRSKVEWLLDNGACISKAAYGAALGGDRAYADELISRGASIRFVARGAAKGGDRAYANELIKHRPEVINSAAHGAGECRDVEYANQLLEKGASAYSLAAGFATTGDRESVMDLIEIEKQRNHGHCMSLSQERCEQELIVQGAAIGGHIHLARDLGWKFFLVPEDIVFQALAQGGHIDSIKSLGSINTDLEYKDYPRDHRDRAIAYGAAFAGRSALAEKIRERHKNIDIEARAAVLSKNIAYANSLIQNGANIKSVAMAIRDSMATATKEPNFTLMLRTLSAFEPTMIPELVKSIKNTLNFTRHDRNVYTALKSTTKRAIVISRSNRLYGTGYSTALALSSKKLEALKLFYIQRFLGHEGESLRAFNTCIFQCRHILKNVISYLDAEVPLHSFLATPVAIEKKRFVSSAKRCLRDTNPKNKKNRLSKICPLM